MPSSTCRHDAGPGSDHAAPTRAPAGLTADAHWVPTPTSRHPVASSTSGGTLMVGTEFFADGVEVPGGRTRNTTCTKSTSCSTPSKVTQECFAPGMYEVLALGRHGGVTDTPEKWRRMIDLSDLERRGLEIYGLAPEVSGLRWIARTGSGPFELALAHGDPRVDPRGVVITGVLSRTDTEGIDIQRFARHASDAR